MTKLNVSEVTAAVHYNRGRGFRPAEIERIQAAVGATPDGSWGPQTVQKVAAWQAARGLSVDGKVGPRTLESIEEAQQTVAPRPDAPAIEIACGLAAYDQSFPGRTPQEAMRVALDAAMAQGVRHVRYWSSEWLIDDIGNKGASYGEPFLRSLGDLASGGLKIGAWIDDPIGAVRKPEYARRLRDMNVTEAALMINRSNTFASDVPWAMRWLRKDLETVGENFARAGIEVTCTAWPQPSRSQIDAMIADMAWVLPAARARSFEVDTEGNYTSKFLDGFRSMATASLYLARSMRDVAKGRRLELTTFTYHTENSGAATLAPMMDLLLPQAYSVRHRDKKQVGFDDLLGPGRHQRLAIGRARQAAAA
jgi:hypothetical protein